MLDLKQIEQTIHEKIPISKEMGISLVKFDEGGLVIKAPLQNNINHRQTAFGGSINAVATLSGWAFLYLMLNQIKEPPAIVIQESSITYLKPVAADFEAVCSWPETSKIEFFYKLYHRKRKARLQLTSQILIDGDVAALFNGVYVALEL
jgi:thioesterase domain-containing protein